jgi:hypothetical protein
MRDYIKRNLVLCVIGVASAAWACGDGDDDGNGTGGTGGTAGKGGSAGSGGKGGSSGSAGKGGSSGSAGKGGSSGSAGKGGSSGSAGSAGSPEGGMGGDETVGGSGGEQGGSAGSTSSGGAGSGGEEAGGTGGVSGAGDGGTDAGGSDAGGAAGAGGAPSEPTVSELCTTICTRVAGFASTTTCAAAETCVETCEAQIGEFGTTNDLYADMLGCLVNNLDASEDYMCADATTLGNLWSVVIAESGPANACDEATCAWTCDPAAYGADPTLVYYGCGCL